ncbi:MULTISPECIES: hypothetical protein [Pseudoalteromonas]|uniref:hypothetical protein n=1 Tax=Pseudoalteromonas TaxID=53246 RepID=UPI0002DF7D67|nr:MULTISPECIES: hypothetical protein [Pseudoalteromonas]MCF6145602.1 hypothetical protein [Pseudoalteromonas mariniglutinosa NCIMB 1770]
MKPITSTPIVTTMNSSAQAEKINNMEVSSDKKQYVANISNDTITTSSQQNTATIKIVTNQLSADETVALRKSLEWLSDFTKKKESSANDMVSETKRILAEVAKEQPNLLNKKFDFTNTGDEIDIIDHDLTKREYNYLKAKLNASDKLVEATDFLNTAVADSKSSTSRSNTKYTKEDVVGRIHVREVIEQAEKRSAERIRITEENIVMKPYDERAMFREEVHFNVLDIVENTSVRFSAKV